MTDVFARLLRYGYLRTAVFGMILGLCLNTARSAEASQAVAYIIIDLQSRDIEVPAAWAKGAGAVIQCESRWRADAINPVSGATGLLQLMRVHEARAAQMGYVWSDMLRPEPNVRVAIAIWEEQSWRPWVCATGLGEGGVK